MYLNSQWWSLPHELHQEHSCCSPSSPPPDDSDWQPCRCSWPLTSLTTQTDTEAPHLHTHYNTVPNTYTCISDCFVCFFVSHWLVVLLAGGIAATRFGVVRRCVSDRERRLTVLPMEWCSIVCRTCTGDMFWLDDKITAATPACVNKGNIKHLLQLHTWTALFLVTCDLTRAYLQHEQQLGRFHFWWWNRCCSRCSH